MNSKSITGVLVAGTLILGGGSAFAAMLPSKSAMSSGPAAHAAGRVPTQLPFSGGSTHTSDRPTYTVKQGDTLSDVAHWFTGNGYASEWVAARSMLGSESHLLYPGERIAVSGRSVIVSPPQR